MFFNLNLNKMKVIHANFDGSDAKEIELSENEIKIREHLYSIFELLGSDDNLLPQTFSTRGYKIIIHKE